MESATTVPASQRTSGEQSGFCATDGEEGWVGRLSVVEPSGADACLSVQAANGRREVRVRRKLERKVGIWWKMFFGKKGMNKTPTYQARRAASIGPSGPENLQPVVIG